MSKVTIIGMENYYNYYNDSLFADAIFPEGVDKELAVNTILLRSGEFESLYSDAAFCKMNITRWAAQYYYTIQKWVDGFAAVFNPVENYDRMEDWTDTHNNKFTHGKTETLTHGKTETLTHGKTETTTHGKEEKTTYGKKEETTYGHVETTENQTSPYNYGGYVADTKNTLTHSQKDDVDYSGSDTIKNSGTDKVVDSGDDKTVFSGNDKTVNSGSDVDSGGTTHTARIHGNIGVMTAVKMLQEYMDFYHTSNLYDLIADIFVTEFCIMVY